MMTIEKKLAQTDLNQFKTEPLKLLVKQLYKHQNFKNKVVLERINRLTYTENTVNLYLQKIRLYLKEGIKNKAVAPRVYDIVDELKATHESILTPSESDRHIVRDYKPTTKKVVSLPQRQETTKITTKTTPHQYGVKCENSIKIFDSKDWALGYLECFKAIGNGKPCELVRVSFEIVGE